MGIAAELTAGYNNPAGPGGGLSSKTSKDKSSSESNDDLEISIKYEGANSNAFISGISITDLQTALLSYPSHCTGDINTYILWPYNFINSYNEVRNDVRLIL